MSTDIALPSHILIIGKPNSGKSLLFNKLTGLQQRVANFPGVTVEVKTGHSGSTTYMDFPGVYSMNPLTRDEIIAVAKLREKMMAEDVAGLLFLLDGTRLERSLFLGLQVQREALHCGMPIVFAVTMLDELRKCKTKIDLEGLRNELGSPIVGISSRTGLGIPELKALVAVMTENRGAFLPCSEICADDSAIRIRAKHLGRSYGPQTDLILKNQNQFDSFFLSSVTGGLSFAAIMIFIFQAIFTWAAPAMDLVESLIVALGGFTASFLPPGMVSDFVKDAIFSGFGSFLVFVPQIFILTFLIGILEDSGYLARAAVICHRPLSFFGLSGKSFVPLLSGHACAIPAIFAARTIESPRRRLLTIIVIPLMSCSARLPVYSLLIVALIPPVTFYGIIGLQGFAFFTLYAFGLMMALTVSSILAKTTYRKESDAPFILELPPYRFPNWMPLFRRSLNHSWWFITKAGTVIFTVTIIIWFLGYFPNGSGNLDSSWLAYLGQAIEPIFRPIGLDWKFGVAVLASFAAREVFVGTLGTLFGIEGADENIIGLATNLHESGLSLASGVALLAFYAIALQCVSTLAVMRKETGSNKVPTLAFLAYGAIGYVVAAITYQLFA